ncbi:hypothetical protein [Roseibium litorale]|uniref:Uncharacterized protein n=1 Tax=Roseibium litorale TaxID=2803841 RepID=A0ABR9CH47_9HYPH|nr:hypothetical protein [Roseibium litorale]MBD8890083.1 hypothetical protein [Roseibium litorale]
MSSIGTYFLRLAFCLVVYGANSLKPTLAHSPYFTETVQAISQEFGPVSYKVLNGDGVLFADPKRLVAVTEGGNLLAASPLSSLLLLHCTTEPPRSCAGYDALSGQVFEPDEGRWLLGPEIEEDGKPLVYPELLPPASGFVSRYPSLSELLYFEGFLAAQMPKTAAVLVSSWTVIWLLATRLFTRARRSQWRFSPVSFRGIAGTLASILAMTGILTFTIYAWLFFPTSPLFAATSCALGLALALMVRKLVKRLSFSHRAVGQEG